MYRFTQHSFQQNRRITIDWILEQTLSLDNEDVYLDSDEIGEIYVNWLKKPNSKDILANTDTDTIYNNIYGTITTE